MWVGLGTGTMESVEAGGRRRSPRMGHMFYAVSGAECEMGSKTELSRKMKEAGISRWRTGAEHSRNVGC